MWLRRLEHLPGVKPDPTVQGSPINLLTQTAATVRTPFPFLRGNGASSSRILAVPVEPSTAAIAEVDTLKFEGVGLTAENILPDSVGSDLVMGLRGIQDIEV